jgi:hypothetical protein
MTSLLKKESAYSQLRHDETDLNLNELGYSFQEICTEISSIESYLKEVKILLHKKILA